MPGDPPGEHRLDRERQRLCRPVGTGTVPQDESCGSSMHPINEMVAFAGEGMNLPTEQPAPPESAVQSQSPSSSSQSAPADDAESLRQAVEAQAEYLDGLMARVEHLTRRESKLVSLLAEAHAKLLERDRRLDGLMAQSRAQGDLASQLEAHRQEREVLVGELEAHRQERETLVGEREAYRQEREALVGELEAYRQEREVLVGELEAHRQEREVLIRELEAHRQERETLVRLLET